MFLYSSCALQRITLARSGSVSSVSSPALSLLSDWRYIEYCCTRSSLIKPPCVCCIWCFRHASYLYRRQQNLHFRGRILMIKWYCWNLCCVFLYGTNLYDAIFSNATDWVTPIRLSAMARVPKMTRKKSRNYGIWTELLRRFGFQINSRCREVWLFCCCLRCEKQLIQS